MVLWFKAQKPYQVGICSLLISAKKGNNITTAYQVAQKLMSIQFNFIVKVLIISLSISLVIKYASPSLPPIPATSGNALIAVLTPAIILACALLWRFWKFHQHPVE